MSLADRQYTDPIQARICSIIQEQLPLDQWSAIDSKRPILIGEDNNVVEIPLMDDATLVVHIHVRGRPIT